MKKLIFLTMLVTASFIANAQVKVYTGGVVGVGSTTAVIPSYSFQVTNGDANVATSTKGYLINGTYMLWHNNKSGSIYVGGGGSSSSSGSNNSFIGYQSGNSNTTAGENVALGYQALYTQSYTPGSAWSSYNVAVGNGALFSNQSTTSATGYINTAVGHNALYSNTYGRHNSGFGFKSLYANTTGDGNTAVGLQSLQTTNSGSYNTGIGWLAGTTNQTGSYNTCVGYSSDVSASNTSNASSLGYSPPPVPTNRVYLGNTSVTVVAAQVATSTYSDRRVKSNYQWNVPGIEFIKLLKPVTYNYDIHKENSILGYPMKRDLDGNLTGEIDTAYWEGKYNIEDVRFSGFIAQEVDSAAQEIGYDFSGVVKGEKLMGLRYSEFVVPLVKAVQEQQLIIETLNQQVAVLKEKVAILEAK